MPIDLRRRYMRKRPLVRKSRLPNARNHHRENLLRAAGETAGIEDESSPKRQKTPGARFNPIGRAEREREPRHSSRAKS